MRNIYKKRRIIFLAMICVVILAIFLRYGSKTYKQIKYFNKPVAKTRPKNVLNYGKSITSIINKPIDKNKVTILVEKSKYKLTIFYKGKAIKSYPIVMGPNPIDDKFREGDNRTPEGKFKIKMLYPHRKWSKFLWLDYPTKNSWAKHNKAKKEKKIDKNSSIGGEIGIHGVPTGDDDIIDEGINWTAGCISVKRKDVDEIYEISQVGTSVEIKH